MVPADGVDPSSPQHQPHLPPLVQAIAIALHARTANEELWATRGEDFDRIEDAAVAVKVLRDGAEERVLNALPVWARRADNGEHLARIAVEAVLGYDY